MVIRKIAQNATAQAQKQYQHFLANGARNSTMLSGDGVIQNAGSAVSKARPSMTPNQMRQGSYGVIENSSDRGIPAFPGGSSAAHIPASSLKSRRDYTPSPSEIRAGGTSSGGGNFPVIGGSKATNSTFHYNQESNTSAGSGGFINNALGTAKGVASYGKSKVGPTYDFMARQMKLTPDGAQRVDYSGMTIGEGAKATGKWFTQGSKSDIAKKMALGGAGFMGANSMVRSANGGGMTYNNKGQSDIAGVPFV